MPQGLTTKGDLARLFAQLGCGEKWVPLGCYGFTGLIRNPVTLRYEKCIDSKGKVKTQIVNQEADPAPFTMTVRGSTTTDRQKYLHLMNRMEKGCVPNLLLAPLDCPDPNSAGDPTSSTDWWILSKVYRASGDNIGNNTYTSLDAKNATPFDLQVQLAYDAMFYEFKKSYSQLAIINDPEVSETDIDSIAFLDVGKCADGSCVKCGGEGCQIVLTHTNIGFEISLDGGDVWAGLGAAAAAGYAAAYDGKLFRIDRTNSVIYVTTDGTNWTTALTDVAFASPTNIVKFDVNFYGVAGANGAMWWSTDGGANWVQVRTANAAFTDYLHLCYNPGQDRLWSFGTDAGAANGVVEYSDDKGKSWTQVTAAAGILDALYGRLFCADHATFLVAQHDLWVTECDAAGTATDLVERAIVGATGEITGIGNCDPLNCNFMWLTTDDGQIFASIDGGLNWKEETISAAVTIDPSANINPVSCCHSVDGDKLVFGFGLRLIQSDTIASYFG